jgi:hypothetical protein
MGISRQAAMANVDEEAGGGCDPVASGCGDDEFFSGPEQNVTGNFVAGLRFLRACSSIPSGGAAKIAALDGLREGPS